MSNDFVLYVPKFVLDSFPATVDAMLTEHVIIDDTDQIRFFHESFFDYSFARRFCAKGGSLVQLLLSSDQLLFRRSQVRQILAFLRDHEFARYVAELETVLTDPRVRFHIKRLVFVWLGSLARPSPREWEIVSRLSLDSAIAQHALPPIRNSLSWCDLLHELGILSQYLGSSDEMAVHRAMWLLSFEQVQRSRSEIVAQLLGPYRSQGQSWTDRLRWYFRFGNAYQSRQIQELFLEMVDEGSFDTASEFGDLWDCLHSAREHAPGFALEGITRWLDRRIIDATDFGLRWLSEPINHNILGTRLLHDVARLDPTAYAQAVFPRVLRLVANFSKPSVDGLSRDRIWGCQMNSPSTSISDSLINELEAALKSLAVSQPDLVELLTQGQMATESEIITVLLLRTWSANPTRFGPLCIRFLADDRRRLDIGYGSRSGEGTGVAAISRDAIRQCSPYVSASEHDMMERAVLSTSISGDKSSAQEFTERLLLEAIGEEFLSEAGRSRLILLRVRFAEQSAAIPPRFSPFYPQIESPIPLEVTSQFDDDEWVAAMRTHNAQRSSRHELSGSADELSRLLRLQARLERRRFAALADRLEDSIRVEYFEAILDGICGQENLSADDRRADDREFELLDSEIVISVIRRIHQLPDRPCGLSICRAFAKIANRAISENDLQILAYYAIEDATPVFNCEFDEDEESRADDPYIYGWNSVRGSAAVSIQAMLFANYANTSVFFLPVIRKMVNDHSLPVRICAVLSLLPVLNHCRDEAVQLFLEACSHDESIYGCFPAEEFIRYASSTHYSQVRGGLVRALDSKRSNAVAAAARQICLAAFTSEEAESDAAKVRKGTERMRLAAAQIYSHNLGEASLRSTCQTHVSHFFADESKAVRAEAAGCFSHLHNVDYNQYTQIVQAYIESIAFPSPHDDLLRCLENTTWQLPSIILRLAERFVAIHGIAAGDISTAAAGDAYHVSKLIMRLYAQTNDGEIRSKCLDLIDEMERYGFLGIDAELAEHDR